MKTNRAAKNLFAFRRVSGLIAALGMAVVIYSLSSYACRHLVPSWHAQVRSLNVPQEIYR